MAKEIERKFLVNNLSFKQKTTGVLYKQAYLHSRPSVRIRIVDRSAFITIKGVDNGISRSEYEYEIPLQDAQEIMNTLCKKPILEKYRYKLEYEGFIWEIDEFLDENEGLIVAEIELDSETQAFSKPDFVGDEITYDFQYRNANLVDHPYKNW